MCGRMGGGNEVYQSEVVSQNGRRLVTFDFESMDSVFLI